MDTRTPAPTKLSRSARSKIRQILDEAKRFGTALSNWRCTHMAAFCAAMKAGLDDLVNEMRATCGITGKVIAEWGAKKKVQRLRDQYLAA